MINQGRFPFEIVNNILIGEEAPIGNDDVNIGELILNALKSRPDFVAQVDATTGKEVTFQEIRNKSVKLAMWMKYRGVRPGDMIGICANHHGMMYAFLASLYIGAIPVLWHEKHIYDCGKLIVTVNILKMMFIHDIFAIMLYDDDISVKHPRPVVIVFGIFPAFITYDTLQAKVDLFFKQEAVDEFNCVKLDENRRDSAVILYTRATTNVSKGVKIPHTTFMTSVNQQVLDMLPSGVGMWVGSFSSFTNLILAVHSIVSYKKIIGFVGHRKEEVCQAIEKHKVDWVLLETYMCRDMVNSNLFTKHNFSSLKMLIFTGSPISYDDHSNLIQLLPNVSIISLYGTTETGIISCQTKVGKIKSSGYVGKNVRLQIIDINDEKRLGPYMCGEIWCKYKDLMNASYHDRYNQSEKLTDKNGWHHTGDLGYYDKDGEIFVVERVANLICFNEFKISPAIIENVISRHSAVENVAVVAMTDEDDCEHPFAYISSKPTRPLNLVDLINEVANKLDDHMLLRGGVERLYELPYAIDGNIDRVYLRDKANGTYSIPDLEEYDESEE